MEENGDKMDEKKYQRLWKKYTKEYVIITDLERSILIVSDNVRGLFQEAAYPETCMDYFARARHQEILTYKKKKYRVEVNKAESGYIIIFRDCTKELELGRQVENLDALAENYEMLFNRFGDSSMYVTDGKGITTWVGSQVAHSCGVSSEYLIGKSVYDLEEEGVFYPSITVRVLESLNYETIVQNTKTGYQAIAMGFPLFDKNNHLVKVISFSKKFKAKDIADKEFAPDYEIDMFYPEIISGDLAMNEVKNMVEACSKVDTPAIIYGEAGVKKIEVARCIHKLSRRCNNPFVVFQVDQVSKQKMMDQLFGGNCYQNSLLYQALGGTLYITNLYAMPYEVQNRLFRVMKGEGLEDENGMTIRPDVRFIAGSNEKVDVGNSNERHCRFLTYLFQAMEIEIPPLRKRRKDILLLLRYYQQTFKDRYDKECEFSSKAKQALFAYDWKGNVRELEKFMQSKALEESHTIIELEDLPEYIVRNEEQEKEDNVFNLKEVIPLNDALQKMEIYLIQRALRESRNAKEAAQLLGIDPSTLSRKIQKYGMESK